ncbi:MAG: HEPN domain-containing protein [Desulfuromonadales bacterium]
MNAGSHAQQLMQMAAKDISALRVMISSEAIADEIFGFHAQQAAEKVLKAWIDQAGGTFGWVHDLRILLLTLQDLGFSIERYLELIHLNSYAVRFRYEPSDEEDAPLDRLETLRMVNELYEHVLNNSEAGENL